MPKKSPAENVAAVAAQIGGTVLPDSAQWVNRFQVKSTSSSRLYVIAQRATDKVWGCSCPGWRHYRKCKHCTDVLRRLSNVARDALDATTLAMLDSARTAYLDLEPAKATSAPIFKGREVDLS